MYVDSGIEAIGAVPWGAHFCQFYETADDLVDTLVPYFKAGLDGGERCMWVTAQPLTRSTPCAAPCLTSIGGSRAARSRLSITTAST